jgi:hypothetical protein
VPTGMRLRRWGPPIEDPNPLWPKLVLCNYCKCSLFFYSTFESSRQIMIQIPLLLKYLHIYK